MSEKSAAASSSTWRRQQRRSSQLSPSAITCASVQSSKSSRTGLQARDCMQQHGKRVITC
eukprot:1908266-Rhodomonas_salina.1